MIKVIEVFVFLIEFLCRAVLVIANQMRARARFKRKKMSRETLGEKMKNAGVVDFRRLNRLS